MPDVNAIKGHIINKIRRIKMEQKIKNNAYETIILLNLKENDEPLIAAQKVYYAMEPFGINIANSKVIERLLTVKALPKNVKESIKKSSPNTSGRKNRETSTKAGAAALYRMGIPRGPAHNIIDIVRFKSKQKQPRRQ